MARLVNEENRSVDLLVAGHFVDEPFRHQIDAAIAQHQLGQHVHFLGYQTNLSPLYQAVDLLVIPSLNEPFGRVVIEAMRAGVPCVAANSGGIPEIVTDGDTGRLFPPTDVFALCQAVGDLLDDAAERQRLRENAGRMVRTRFTIEAQVEAVLQSYRQLTAAR
jgi:glycosyltransferase involved in cell wall biosynthesis